MPETPTSVSISQVSERETTPPNQESQGSKYVSSTAFIFSTSATDLNFPEKDISTDYSTPSSPELTTLNLADTITTDSMLNSTPSPNYSVTVLDSTPDTTISVNTASTTQSSMSLKTHLFSTDLAVKTSYPTEVTDGTQKPCLNSLSDKEWIAIVLAVVLSAALVIIALIYYFRRNYIRKASYENEQSGSDVTSSKLSSSVKLKDISGTCNSAFEPETTSEVSLSNVDEISNPTRNHGEVQLMKTFSNSSQSSTKNSDSSTTKAEKGNILDEIYLLAADVQISQTAIAYSNQAAQNQSLKGSIKDCTEAREISETTVNILYEEYRSEPMDTPKRITGEKNDSTTSGIDSKAPLNVLACIGFNDHKDDACENIEKANDKDKSLK